MSDGFLVINEKDWEKADEEQRAWMTFNTLKSIDGRLSILEKKSFFDKVCSTAGGVIGGAVAAISLKLGLG